MTGQAVLILTGPPGVGKSTTAGILAARSNRGVHLQADLFFHFIRSGYVEPWKRGSHEQNTVVMRAVADAAATYAGAGYFTVVDGVALPRWFLQPLRDSLREAGHAVAYAVLRAPLALCAERAGSRAVYPVAEARIVEEIWSQFSDLGAWEANAIDIGPKTAEEVADEVSERLRAGRLTI
jgi:predicted kinase